MTDLSTGGIVRRLIALSRMLDAATEEIAVLEEKAVLAKVAHEKAYATAYLDADGPAETRKQTALLATAEQRQARDLADVAVRATTERIRTLRTQIDVARSLNAAQRTEAVAAGIGQP